MMPNKTIYVSDMDMPIFEKAQQLAGDNLSSTIVQALRRYVEAHEQRESGYHEITLRVGSGQFTLKRFTGRLLATGQYHNADHRWQDVFEIFQSIKGKIVVYHGNVPTWWNGWEGGRGGGRGHRGFGFGRHEHQHGPMGMPERLQRKWESQQQRWKNDWSQGVNWENLWGGKGEFKLDVYDTLEAIQTEIPEDLYERVKNQLSGNEIENLDI